MEPGEYDGFLALQGGRCALCAQLPAEGKTLYVDHCHNTGVIRGLLCNTCNVGLGFVEKFRERLAQMLKYADQSDIRSLQSAIRVMQGQ